MTVLELLRTIHNHKSFSFQGEVSDNTEVLICIDGEFYDITNMQVEHEPLNQYRGENVLVLIGQELF